MRVDQSKSTGDMKKWTEEVEVRFPVEDFDAVRSKLVKLGGERHSDATELVRFYDTPQMRYDAAGTHIRIKEIGSGARVELQQKEKEPTASMPGNPERKMKVRREFPIETFATVQDAEAYAMARYPDIVLIHHWTYTKHREHWTLPANVSVELDTLVELARRYVEIEGKPSQIQRLVEAFGFEWEHAVVQSYRSEHEKARRA